MQKLIRRTERAVRKTNRRFEREKARNEFLEMRRWLDADTTWQNTWVKGEKKAALKRSKEDWYLGSLRPNRAFGLDAGAYGAMSGEQLSRQPKPQHMRRTVWPIVQDDRVVIIEGKDKGKIGKVTELMKDKEQVILEGLNQGFAEKSMFRGSKPSDPPRREMSAPLSYDSVRLVHAYTDPDTNVTRDVILSSVILKKQGHLRDPYTNESIYTRYIPGTSEEIPWPDKPDPDYRHYVDDTNIEVVDAETFSYVLDTPPMPPSVLDELRNKYSRFRTRHEEEYAAMHENQQSAKEAQVEAGRRMMMPLAVRAEQKRAKREAEAKIIAEKEKRGEDILSEDLMARIGMSMLREKGDGPTSQLLERRARERAATQNRVRVQPVMKSSNVLVDEE